MSAAIGLDPYVILTIFIVFLTIFIVIIYGVVCALQFLYNWLNSANEKNNE